MFKQIAIAMAFIASAQSAMAIEINWKDIAEKATPIVQRFAAKAESAANTAAKVSCSTSEDMAITKAKAEAEYAVYSASAKVIPAALGGNEIATKANIAIAKQYAAGASSAVLSVGCIMK
jgi:hypothetical protein